MPNSSELKDLALEKLRGNWGPAILVMFIYGLILNLPGVPQYFFDEQSEIRHLISLVATIYAFILGGPMTFGMANYFLKYIRDENPETGDMFEGFKDFGRTFGLYFLMMLFIILWTLLLIVPGIIAAIKYSQAFYLLRDNPDMQGGEAINESKRLMDGYKGEYFYLSLSFLGWALLCLLTLGIGFFWLAPYMQATFSFFYEKRIEEDKAALIE